MQKKILELGNGYHPKHAGAIALCDPKQIKYVAFRDLRYVIGKDIIEAEIALTLEGADNLPHNVVVHTSVELAECDSAAEVHSLLYLKAARQFRKAQIGFTESEQEIRLAS